LFARVLAEWVYGVLVAMMGSTALIHFMLSFDVFYGHDPPLLTRFDFESCLFFDDQQIVARLDAGYEQAKDWCASANGTTRWKRNQNMIM